MTSVHDTSSPGRADDRPPRKNRPRFLGLLAFAGSLVLVAVWLLLGPMRDALHEERDFRAAVACPERTASTGSEGCLRTVTARIDRTDPVEGTRSAAYWLYVTEPGGKTDRARIDGSSGPASATAWSGARIQVTEWRGKIRYVAFSDGRQYTHADPRGSYRPYYSAGLGLGLFGAGFLVSTYWWARISAVSPLRYPWQVSVSMTGAVVLACAGALAPMVTDGVRAALLFVTGAAGLVLVGCAVAVLVLRRRQSGDDTVEVTPTVPDTEQCFLGGIVGEVPYGKNGGGYLVAAPGLLAQTPDPTGAFARRAVPPTLVPQRVRLPYWSDRSDYGGGTLVVECRDGETPVLITTKKENVPWVLGALQPVAARRP
ncbi:hypothetical protein OG762_28600 [Streptomyces sp. NBC_01136]|uniref:hypothetical protein n=1 Tax=Streptomyces sp. NBC_01136 TaxID=2903754 RepID=UPI00386A2078|nr:hypothetical protein OG762_28600 [Streptomyces sp. NBC_01136]